MIEDELIRVAFATMDTASQPNLAPARSDEIRRHVKQVARFDCLAVQRSIQNPGTH
jgi:hypothetical protein